MKLYILLFISLIQCLESKAAKPNVVFILADDLGYGDLSCYGADKIKTPACDKLATQGMQFTDAHSPSAVCTPSRYSILTGRYCWRTWLKNWVLQEPHPLLINTNRLTMGKIFKRAGYVTACVGKWHLGWGNALDIDMSKEMKPGPLEVGFDSFFGVPFSHNSSKKRQVYVRDRKIVNLINGLDYKDKKAMEATVRDLHNTAIRISSEAVSFIDNNCDKPFFLYYPTTNIHFPLTPNSKFKNSSKVGIYGDFVIEFDWAVQQIVESLERNGISENTIVIVTSDNGGRPPRKRQI